MIKFNTLSSQLTFWYSATSALIIAVLFAIFYFTFESRLMKDLDEDLEEDVAEFQRMLNEDGVQEIEAEIIRETKESGESEKAFIQVLDRTGKIIYATDLAAWSGLATNPQMVSQVLAADQPILYTFELETREDSARGLYGKISDDYILHAAESMEEKDDLMELLLAIITAMFLIALPFAAYVGWLMAKKATNGINQVSKTAREIELGALDKRVSDKMWGEEIQTLATTFNAMLDRIRDLILEMREMTDNVAHDLRSPLARIRVIAESAVSMEKTTEQYKIAAADIIDECDRLMEMINASLDLAELEAGAANIEKNRVNLSELVTDACELFHPLADEKHIHLKLNHKPGCFVLGDMQSLQRMLANLLDNAIKYTPREGYINVDVIQQNGSVKVVVADTGVGIPKEEQHKVFERFYRCDENRLEKGCGLGLSFARAVAKAHGGDINLNSEYGKGSAFSVSLRNFTRLSLH